MKDTRKDIWWRTVTFTKNLFKSPSKEIIYLADMLVSDVRSIIGSNLDYITKELCADPMTVPKKVFYEAGNFKLETTPVMGQELRLF